MGGKKMKKKILCVSMIMLLVATVYPVTGMNFSKKISEELQNFNDVLNYDQTESQDWWPMYRHDPRNTGCSESIAPSTNQLSWKQTIGDNIFSATPIVSNDKLFMSTNWYYDFLEPPNLTKTQFLNNPSPKDIIQALTTYQDEFFGGLYCLNADTGAPLWNYPMYAPNDPAIIDDKVYVTDLNTYSYSSTLYCLNIENGAPIWQKSVGGLCLSPTIIADEKIFIGLIDIYGYYLSGSLKCTDLDGNNLWTYPLPSYELLWGSAPAYYDGKIYFITIDMYSYTSGKLYCLNAETGQFIWSQPISSIMYWFGATSPACTNGKVYAVDLNLYSYYGYLKCFNADTGSILWSQNIGLSFSTPAICNDSIYVAAIDLYFYNSRLYRLNAESGAIIWNVPIPGITYFFSSSSPICADYKIFIFPSDFYTYSNDLYCLNMEDGSYLWNYKLDDISIAAPAVADERVYLADYSGSIYALEDLLKIIDISGGIFNVKAEVKNIGDIDISNISWTISAIGGILGMISRTPTGTIPSLGANESKIIRALPIFGMGEIQVIVKVSMPGQSSPIRKYREGYVLGPLVMISS
jgi:outer membrane protein assembly factor BamB